VWLWVVFGNVNIHVQLRGWLQPILALMAAIAIYAIWLAAPVAGLTWALLKVRSAANRRRMMR
jgi:phage-related minor tail protein